MTSSRKKIKLMGLRLFQLLCSWLLLGGLPKIRFLSKRLVFSFLSSYYSMLANFSNNIKLVERNHFFNLSLFTFWARFSKPFLSLQPESNDWDLEGTVREQMGIQQPNNEEDRQPQPPPPSAPRVRQLCQQNNLDWFKPVLWSRSRGGLKLFWRAGDVICNSSRTTLEPK